MWGRVHGKPLGEETVMRPDRWWDEAGTRDLPAPPLFSVQLLVLLGSQMVSGKLSLP